MTKNKKIDKYRRNRVEKLEAIPTGVSIERRHKVFLDSNGLNLSAIVRDAIDALMQPDDEAETKPETNPVKGKLK